ncbi:MAG: hypothetical protein CMC13_05445 [Flavobacteriaceae bacterium]|nr:hypothetical protein [Flavobacteriaceae bacterium]|tara:strand:+ start:910 stop:1365 length:456 start_codon:yes stop_codon:yes gene_type:complete
MKTKPQYITILLLLTIVGSAFAQKSADLSIKTEIELAVAKEQNAFKNGDCDTVLSMMDDDITFLANGNKVPSKQVIGTFCNSMPRPFKTPLSDNIEVFPLTNTSAYTIRTLEFSKDDTTNIQELVTKIWKKTDGIWKITHLHSTAKKMNAN